MLDIIKIIFLGPVNDMKTTPGTSLSVLFLWGVVAYACFVTLPRLANASDVVATQADAVAMKRAAEQLQASVLSLDNRLKYDGMKRDLEKTDTEIAAVDREITRVTRSGSEPSEFLIDRQQRLVSGRAELAQKINAMIQRHPELVSQ